MATDLFDAYYFADKDNDHKTARYYGPIPSLECAKFFASWHRNSSYQKAGAEFYTDAEIDSILNDPGDKAWEFRAAREATYAGGNTSRDVARYWQQYGYQRHVIEGRKD